MLPVCRSASHMIRSCSAASQTCACHTLLLRECTKLQGWQLAVAAHAAQPGPASMAARTVERWKQEAVRQKPLTRADTAQQEGKVGT